MKRRFTKKSLRHITGFALMLILVLSSSISLYSADKENIDAPIVPDLSLTGELDSYKDDLYPHGRAVFPVSKLGDKLGQGDPRVVLIPVFMNNRWVTYPNWNDKLVVQPTNSFKFSVYYDSSTVRFDGVQKYGFYDEENGQDPLAKHFNITYYDAKEQDHYLEWTLGDNARPTDKMKGRKATIIGTSNQPLPTNEEDGNVYNVLLYLRFKVIIDEGNLNQGTQQSVMYIAPDTIKYNDVNVRQENPFIHLMKDPALAEYATGYFPEPNTGLGGINNLKETTGKIEPTKEGCIYLSITDNIPEFEFEINRGIGSIEQITYITDDNDDITMWEVVDPITVDSASTDPKIGKRIMQVKNAITGTRLLNVEVETDQKWLKVKSIAQGSTSKIVPDFGTEARKGKINYIDNGILGQFLDPKDKETEKDGDIFFEIQCDPSELDDDGEREIAGIYTGYITFRSAFAKVSPVRVKVTFIYFRNPLEWFVRDRDPGIKLEVSNNKGDMTEMIFGTGYRATEGVDLLFGETAYDKEMVDGEFAARFFPSPEIIAQGNPADGIYGFGDMNPNDENPRSDVIDNDGNRRPGSRDIRSSLDTNTSIIYYAKFDAGNDDNYPVVIKWNVNDFPDGAQLFLRDAVNGTNFSVNMREANPLGNGFYSYSIQDPKFTEFVIEYTPSRVIKYVDEQGNPIIQPGWNLLSLPVRPTSNKAQDVYKNAMSIPVKFNQNIYQDKTELIPGEGYFIKYPTDIVDTTFAGTYIRRIDMADGDYIRLYPGWNTIGTCSGPVEVASLEFDEYNNNGKPDMNETFEKGVWKYVPGKSYDEVSVMEAGLGYWIYVDKGAYLKLETAGSKVFVNNVANDKETIKLRSTEINIVDNNNVSGSLFVNNNEDATRFALPPVPPTEVFDVRFDNNAYLANTNNSIINLQGVQYPATIALNNADANYTFVDAETGDVIGTIAMNSNDNVVVNKATQIEVLKGESKFAISNYPNPVETTTNFEFTTVENGQVTIKLYDQTGSEVATVYSNNLSAGSHNVEFDAKSLSTGTYFAKIISGNNTAMTTVTVVK